MLYVQIMVCRKNRTIWYVPLVQRLSQVPMSNKFIYILQDDTRSLQCQENNFLFYRAQHGGAHPIKLITL